MRGYDAEAIIRITAPFTMAMVTILQNAFTLYDYLNDVLSTWQDACTLNLKIMV